MRIYIESTIPSYVVARPARDLLQAARQQLTGDWWDLKRGKHELFTSQIVLDEIGSGEAAMAQQRIEVLAQAKLLDLSEDATVLTKRIQDYYRSMQTVTQPTSHSQESMKWIYC